MKKFLFAFLLLTITSTLPIFLAMAKTTPPPEIDEVASPVDANKAVITGTAGPDAQVTVTGGVYQIAPVTADSTGHFSVTVALAQETTNQFFVQAKEEDSEPSESVTVIIQEGAAAAAAYEASTGEDRSAPEAPDLTEADIETTDTRYVLEGTGEIDATVILDGKDSGETVDSSGEFTLTVTVSGDGVVDHYNIALQDEAGNVSSGVSVSIKGNGTAVQIPDSSELTDIQGHWAEANISSLYEKGIVNGYGDGRFGPDNKLTRAQIVKIAVLAFELPSQGSAETFSDVKNSDWFADYVASAADLEIVNGYPDGSFKPDSEVSRAEALKILLEASGLSDFSPLTTNFTDVNSIKDWFAPYSAYAKSIGLVNGYSDGSFRGNNPITRAEVCKLLVYLLNYLP